VPELRRGQRARRAVLYELRSEADVSTDPKVGAQIEPDGLAIAFDDFSVFDLSDLDQPSG